MQVDTLKYFVEVAKAGSFYGASKRLFVSQQGLNKAITGLEAELGIPLFERGKRGVRLTLAGEKLLPHAQRIVEERNLALDEIFLLQHRSAEVEDHITVHTTYYPAQIAAGVAGFDYLLKHIWYKEDSFDKVVEMAANSDGSDLYFIDLHPNSRRKILARRDVMFDPLFRTDYGVVWKEGSPLGHEKTLHRSTVATYPVAINIQKEMAQLQEWLFKDSPLQNIRMGIASPHMLLDFVKSNDGSIALFDSFGFYLSTIDPDMPTDGIHFTPLATESGHCQCGFLMPTGVRVSPRALQVIDMLKRYTEATFSDYMEKYPVHSVR